MGSGSKFDSALSTKGGKANLITKEDIDSNNPLAKEILKEMTNEGINYSKSKIVFALKLENGNKIFLETGGLEHIIERHADQFKHAFNVETNEIKQLLINTISKGKLVSASFKIINDKSYYKNRYYYKGNYYIVCGIAENGYIETAYPKPIGGKK